MATHFTVLGAGGFIGGRLVEHLRGLGFGVDAPERLPAEAYVDGLSGRQLGHAVYCIGLTADFRMRPFETVEAHVGLLQRILERCEFASLTYVSSTRVYLRSERASEAEVLRVDPTQPDDLFALSKLLGEALCLGSGKLCRVVRPSNVFGVGDPSQNFLPSVLREAKRTGRVKIMLSPASAKDFVGVEDVVRWIAEIAVSGTQKIYNLAGGRNISNAEIAEVLGRLGVAVEFAPGGSTVTFPPIDIARVTGEFGPPRVSLIERLPDLFMRQT